MSDNKNVGTELWYRASARKRVVLVIAFLLPIFPIVFFFRRIHVSMVIICFLMTPWVLAGAVMVVRPTWIDAWMRWWRKTTEQMGESLEKRVPPGFP